MRVISKTYSGSERKRIEGGLRMKELALHTSQCNCHSFKISEFYIEADSAERFRRS